MVMNAKHGLTMSPWSHFLDDLALNLLPQRLTRNGGCDGGRSLAIRVVYDPTSGRSQYPNF